MTAIEERYAVERAKWDAHAGDPTEPIEVPPPGLDFEAITRREVLLTGIADFLGPLAGQEVVEYGCGLGKLTVLLARSGARVHAFDLSEGSIEVARERARRCGVAHRITFSAAPGEALPYDDASFDLAVGKAVIHHIDARAGAKELARILRPGGRAAFSEPLGTNPVVQFVRDYVPYPLKHDRGADIPLRYIDIEAWLAPFASGDIRGIQLFSMVERGLGFSHKIPVLREFDRLLLKRWPNLWPFCRYGVLTLTR
jgi:SAM-dependent methyltransferase